MMKVALINGSPKGNNGASGHIIKALCDRLSGMAECVVCELAKQSVPDVVDAMRDSDALVFASPLYVDSLPSGLVRFLDENQNGIASAAARAKVYAVLNNGFYDAKQNSIALEMMEIFCEASGLAWGRGLGIGGGGMIEVMPIDRFPLKKFGAALDILARNIRGNESAENYFVEPGIPRFLYVLTANFGMRREIKKRRAASRRQ